MIVLGPVYTMHIYPSELQKRINICAYKFYPFRRNTEKEFSMGINPKKN